MKRLLTIDDLYDPKNKIRFEGSPASDFIWLGDRHYIRKTTDPQSHNIEWSKVDARTGDTEPFIDPVEMENALRQVSGLSAADANKIVTQGRFTLNSAHNALLFNHENDIFYYEVESHQGQRLTNSTLPQVGEEFSPDGRLVSFVRGYNIYVVDLESRREWALTDGGNEKLLNGRLDWVYQEELYGRGNFKGHWWSPDSSAIAYLQLDELQVKEFPVIDDIPLHPSLEITNYPLAGDPNPRVRLGIVSAIGGSTRWIDTVQYESIEFLIVRVNWTPDSASVAFQVQDREQRCLDLNFADCSTGKTRTVIHEECDTWVSVAGEPLWLKDKSFLWLSERTGWKHIYHHGEDGRLKGSVTAGDWEMRVLLGVDEENDWIYFSAAIDSTIAEQTYRVRLSGQDLQCVTRIAGTHRSVFNASHTQFVDVWSEIGTPPQIRLHSSSGETILIVDENRIEVLTQYEWSRPELLQIRARDGFVMAAMMIKPPGFDPSRKYPVMSYTYSGPHVPRVVNAWGGEIYLWHQLLAQKGYIVWICDNRTASGKGAVSAWPIYRNAGELELRDLEDGITWLKNQSYVDGERIGLWGWSYGGYMTSYALTHSTSFKIGIAGAPVTDWRNYDSIYTERYMATPQNNPEGYERSSVVKAAANLHGKLLLIHGAIDDNVHPQNTIQFLYELQKAGKSVELMIYPKSRHHVEDPLLLKHLRALMTDFILGNL